MTTWAIGDVQGCHAELCTLLETVRFSGGDQLWFVGDLVNRGPGSLETLRLIRSLGEQAVTVLGNHDLHWLAIHFGGHKAKRGDTFDSLAAAPDVDELSHWLRHLPLAHFDAGLQIVLVHAGIYPRWTSKRLLQLTAEVEAVIRSDRHVDFFRDMYGNEPAVWSDSLMDMNRLRFITNACTRMRLVDADDVLDFLYKEELSAAPPGLRPWFEVFTQRFPGERVVFGHWASLDGKTGIDNIQGIDTGCVWGRSLTALNLATFERVSVSARG